MKKKLLNPVKPKFETFFILTLFVFLLIPSLGYSQANGDYRSAKTGGGWASAGTWDVYSATPDCWIPTTVWAASTAYTVGTYRTNGANLYIVTVSGTSAASGGPTGTTTGIDDGTVKWDYVNVAPAAAPTSSTNVIIMDGVAQTSNGSGYVAGTLTIGQGNAFSGTAVLTGTAVTSVTINNPGKLIANPGVVFAGAGTTQATGSLTYYMNGTYYKNKGTGYTTATISFGSAWVASTAYTAGQQRTNGGNFYTVVTAGTSDVSGGPTGTGTSITDGTVVWNFAGSVPTAHAVIDAGKVTDVVIDSPGSGYIASGSSFPGINISGDGTGASYGIQMGVESVIITAGGNYTVVPSVIAGSSFQCGNSGTARTVTISGDVTFKSGSNMISGGGSKSLTTPILSIGGNLVAETPISFVQSYPPSYTSYTTVNFTKSGDASISGAGSCKFFALGITSTTNLTMNSTPNIVTNTLTIPAGGKVIIPSDKTLTVNGTDYNNTTLTATISTGINNLSKDQKSLIYTTNGKITVVLNGLNTPKGKIAVYNLLGQVITIQTITDRTTIISKNLKAGTYFVKIQQTGGDVLTQKIIME
jgi:hypothetical protein